MRAIRIKEENLKLKWFQIASDSGGNNRMVTHYAPLADLCRMTCDNEFYGPLAEYEAIVKLLGAVGGKRHSTHDFSGGIVFKPIDLHDKEKEILEIISRDGKTAWMNLAKHAKKW